MTKKIKWAGPGILIVIALVVTIQYKSIHEYISYIRGYNIIFITIDALRADHMGCYGHPRNTSPHMDAFASDNILFKNFFTVVPKTGPSMTSFFSGKYIQHHGVIKNSLKKDPSIASFVQLLPGQYKTGAFVANPTLNQERGYSTGFDQYEIFLGNQKRMTQKAIKWLEQYRASGKFFLWLHYIDPHGFYKPPPEFHEMFVNDQHYDASRKVPLDYTPIEGLNENYILGAVPKYQRLGNIDVVDYYIAQYDAEIRHTDTEVGKLFAYLKKQKLFDNSIIIITADHGESLGEDNYYFEHGMLVNEGSIHIPLIISHPKIKKPLIINSLLQSVDLFPTMLDEFGSKFPTEIDGINFSRLYYDRRPDFQMRKYIYSCTPDEYIDFFETVRNNQYKLIRRNEKEALFFDISREPFETTDVSDEIASDTRRSLLRFVETFGKYSKTAAPGVILPKERLEELKSLGYVE